MTAPARSPDRQPLGVILAGGRATRMGGGDKALLTLGNGPLLTRVIARLAPQVSGLALSANGDPARFAPFGLPVLADSIADFPGPLAGVLAGLDWAAGQGADAIVTAAADTPFFPKDIVTRLQAVRGPSGLALAATESEAGKVLAQPTFGLWPVALREDLRARLAQGLRKVTAWTDAHGAGLAVWPDRPYDPFFNVNTPDDLARAARMLEEEDG